jgi:hypothetical protein
MSHTDPELLQQFLREELPGDQMMMGGVVTFCIDAMDHDPLVLPQSAANTGQTPGVSTQGWPSVSTGAL